MVRFHLLSVGKYKPINIHLINFVPLYPAKAGLLYIIYTIMKIYQPIVYSVFSLFLLLSTLLSSAQDLELKYAEFKDNKLIVHYSLRDTVIGRAFTVRLYASKDNFLNPLEKVSGDVGLEVRPGPDNKIVWDAQAELGPMFNERVSLEIRGRVFVPFINTENFNHYKVYKRKRKYTVTWTGGTPQNILNFDLYNGKKKILTYPNIANVGNYTFEFPVYVKPKKDYQFRISDSKNKEDVVYTNKFKIKRKVPLLLKAAPVVVLGSALLFLSPKESEGDIPAFPESNLPKN